MTQVSAEHRLLIDLCLSHLVPFFWQGPGLLLIDAKGASLVLDDLDTRGIAVLGLDGFELRGSSIRPRLDLIYSAGTSPETLVPRVVVDSWPDNTWVDVTI